MRGVGRTVFSGSQVEEFQVEILGVLENVGPRQSIILARLSGGPLEKTGVLAGMSGSPVYLEGKLAGAVAYSFPFTTEPIAGIRPIAEMVEGWPTAEKAAAWAPVAPAPATAFQGVPPLLASTLKHAVRLLPPSPLPIPSEPQLMPIATPVALGGFSERTLEVFGPQLRSLGLRPMQGLGGRNRFPSQHPEAEPEPGSMVTVGLIRGDLDLSAAGTLTYIDGKRVYGFGHRFLSSGPSELPLSRSSVITVVPNLSNSFKIAGTGSPLGKIVLDRSSGVAGLLGEEPRLLPVELNLHSSLGGTHNYRLEIVNDRFLSPFLVQMALFSAADATERQIGAASFQVRGAVLFDDDTPALRLDNMFAGSSSVALQLAVGTAIPLAYLMQSGFGVLAVRAIRLDVESIDQDRRVAIDRAWASKMRVRAGESVEFSAVLKGPNSPEIVKTVEYQVPVGMRPGDLHVTFSDSTTINLQEWQSLAAAGKARDVSELVRAMNRLRPNDRLYMRVWRPGRVVRLQTERLPSPPASVLSVLSAPTAEASGGSDDWQATIAEFELNGLSSVVEGNLSVKVAVIE